jgi:chitin disaccharide deacetylase
MVGAPAAGDAVARARRSPHLRVGLHLVLVDGCPLLPADAVPALVDERGTFSKSMLRAGLSFFFSRAARRQLASEIRAQFEAFRATGLALDHVNTHKHMHIHPTVCALIMGVGRDFGMRAMRVPAEPMAPLRRAAAAEGSRVLPRAYAPWVALLRRRLCSAGLAVNDHLLGVAWSGGMTEARMLRLIAELPEGVSELYCHPAAVQTPSLASAMPGYHPVEELAGLLSPAVRQLVHNAGIELIAYSDLALPS